MNSYDEIVEKLRSEGRVRILNDKENYELLRELNEGIPEFARREMYRRYQSTKSLSKTIFNLSRP